MTPTVAACRPHQRKDRDCDARADQRRATGYTTAAPWVVTDDTGAFLDFVSQAFGGEELGRVPTEDGLIGHAEIRVGDTVVLAFDRHPDWPRTPSLLRVFVADADEAFTRAVAAGGQVVTALADDAFGRRGGRIKDRLQDPAYAETMRVAQETLDAELNGEHEGRSNAPVRPRSVEQ